MTNTSSRISDPRVAQPRWSGHSWKRTVCSVLAALGMAVALSGCVIEPWHHSHPHYYGY